MICFRKMAASNVKTNDDFRKIIGRKSNIMKLLIFCGFVTILVTWIAAMAGLLDSDSFFCGLYVGLGCGLILAGTIKVLQMRKLLRNEELLKKERIKFTDERNRAITAKAVQTSIFIILVLSYAAMLIGVFYSKIIFYCYWSMIIAFFLVYLACIKYYNHKM